MIQYTVKGRKEIYPVIEVRELERGWGNGDRIKPVVEEKRPITSSEKPNEGERNNRTGGGQIRSVT